MAVRRRGGAELRQIEALFNVGTIGDLTDGQLLERFAMDPDETAELAFSALVERHGPLVWRVCRAILRDEHHAEDAFQATFLVLVRKARSLWVRDSLGHWLHRVACYTASCLRARVIRRRRLDQRRGELAPTPAFDLQTPPDADRDAAIHEELNRLPAKYRLPVVLCDLEGHTHQQAARSLGWPIGTIKSRQTRGRSLLRERLTRRGLGLAVAGLVLGSPGPAAIAAIPRELARSTVDAAMRRAGRLLTGAAASTSVLTLTQGVLRAMLWTRVRLLAIATVAIGIASGGAIVYVRGSQDSVPPKNQPVANRPAAAATVAAQPKGSRPHPAEDMPLRATLDEAVKSAQAIVDPSARRVALSRIATAQADMDDLPGARATARLARQSADRIDSEMNRHHGLERVARLQAKLGDVESARQIFDQIIGEARAKGPGDRMSVLAHVAIAQDECGLRADALDILKGATEEARQVVARTSKSDIYYRIGIARCQIGDFDGVLRIVESLQGDLANARQTYLQYLARDCDKAGPAEARKILAKALELSKAIPYVSPRWGTQKMIAQAMARNGDIPGALAASKLIGQHEATPAENGLLSFFNGRRQAERDRRRRMDEDLAQGGRHEVADVLAVIAAEQAKSDDRAAAKKSFREAMELTLSEPEGVLKTQRLRILVEHLAGAGELEAARVAIEAIRGDEANKAHALVALAKAQAKAGDRAGARASLVAAFQVARETKSLPDVINDNVAASKDFSFREIATAQIELGEIADALQTVSVHGHKGLKGEIQAEDAGRRARQGDIAAALKTADSIQDAGSKAEAFRKIAHARSRTGARDVAHDWAARLGSPQERASALLGVVEGELARRRGQ